MKNLLLYALVCIPGIFSSCNKNPENIVPPSEISYQILDSMRLNPSIATSDPDFYHDFNDKAYLLTSTSVASFYKQDGNDVIILFRDTSANNFESSLQLRFRNKNFSTLAGSYSPADDVFYKYSQKLSASTSVILVNEVKMTKGAITISTDNKTNTVNGTINSFQYSFGNYLPYYFSGSTVTQHAGQDLFLESGGSFRRHTIVFKYVKQ